MIDLEDIRNKTIYLLATNNKCLRKALSSQNFISLFQGDEVGLFIVKEFFDWFKQYESDPSPKLIFEKNRDTFWGPKLKIRFKVILDLQKGEPPTENEFDAYVNDLKVSLAKVKFSDALQNYTDMDKADTSSPDKFGEYIREFGKNFIEISNDLQQQSEGEWSYTTHDAEGNIERILNRDLSNEKRFRIGHRVLDEETKGFRYGELLMILGNINQGKSMVLSNIAYNLFKDGHNVLLLTCEMRPEMFDERIYSRASAVDYGKILSGRQFFTPEDKAAFDECLKTIKSKDNHIITKFLNSTDNVATVEGYINDLRISRNFIPDVVIVDSLEHITPLYPPEEKKDWQMKGKVVEEFKAWAETFMNMRGVFVISTHQAKTETNNKKFDEITYTDFGRSKVVPEKADFSLYLRTVSELNIMNVKLIKARRSKMGVSWSMAVDFSKCLVTDTEDETNSESLFVDDGDDE